MNVARVEVPERARRKALTLGEASPAWLAGLDSLLRDLARLKNSTHVTSGEIQSSCL